MIDGSTTIIPGVAETLAVSEWNQAPGNPHNS